MQKLGAEKNRKQILDFCESLLSHPQALMILIEKMTPDIFLLNCTTAVRNILHSAGHSDQILE